jgi:hypothetical protein
MSNTPTSSAQVADGLNPERVAEIIERIEAIIDSTMIFRHSAEGKAVLSLVKQLQPARRTAATGADNLPPLPALCRASNLRRDSFGDGS